jgi:hypothetical protein
MRKAFTAVPVLLILLLPVASIPRVLSFQGQSAASLPAILEAAKTPPDVNIAGDVLVGVGDFNGDGRLTCCSTTRPHALTAI